VPALHSDGPAGTRTTGQAQVVSLPVDYAATFPGELRPLVGARTGVLLAQPTAANLALSPGDSFTVQQPDDLVATLPVDGVVDMPAADSFFQIVGTTPGAGATTPPDNVVLVPPDRFAAVGGAPVVHQFHVGFDHRALPPDPAAAATAVQQRANHLEVAVAGGALPTASTGPPATSAGPSTTTPPPTEAAELTVLAALPAACPSSRWDRSGSTEPRG
jgi:putative ABC transport system permease protein